jgi:mono/diheme cytochrome c family protein
MSTRTLSSLRHSWQAPLFIAALVIAVLALGGCAQTGDIVNQPKNLPLAQSDFFPDGRSARNPPAGSVSYSASGVSPNDPTLTGLGSDGKPVAALPVKVTAELVQKGQERFNIYCIPCHGADGAGNGKVTGFGFPHPPSLLADAAKGLSDGEIFQIIQNGKGKMFPYGYRVKADERWAVIAYVRALQLKNGKVTPQDLTPDLLNQIGKQQ